MGTGDHRTSESDSYVVVDTVSKSGLGGGPSGLTSSATPRSQPDSTPSKLPYQGAAHVAGKPTSVDSSCQTISYCVNSFSSKTCIELLKTSSLTHDQLQFEANYFRSLNHEAEIRTRRNLSPLTLKGISNHIGFKMSESVCAELDSNITFKRCNANFNSFSYMLEQAEQQLKKMTELQAEHESWSPVTPLPTIPRDLEIDPAETDTASTPTITDQVWNLNDSISFPEFSVPDILSELKVNGRSSYGRSTCYYGSKPYSYGQINHKANPYPSSMIFDKIFDKVSTIDPDFTMENFTCMVTYYPSGTAIIPAHSDNERSIKPNSTIYTVSIGAERSLRLVNREGPLVEHDMKLPHGSLSTMSADSQKHWTHELLFDRTVTEPRLSFTFRYICEPIPKVPAPALEKPVKKAKLDLLSDIPATKGKERILFLHDSILNSAPEHIFGKVPNHRCVKKQNYYLTDIFKFSSEFKYSSFVIISCGVNDLSTRYGDRLPMSGQELFDFVSKRISRTCELNPNTTFVFNSLIHTRHAWLNNEINIVNNLIFRLICTIPNMRFFDSLHALVRDPISRHLDHVIDPEDGRGTHLTFRAKRLISDQLVNALVLLEARRSGRVPDLGSWTWPDRPSHVTMFRERARTYISGVNYPR